MIYLASTSPRRKSLLKQYGIPFRILPPVYEETNKLNLRPSQLVRTHALEKGRSCAALIRNGVILSADTIVYLNGKVIGKPKNKKDAFKILISLQGRWHKVYTGVALIRIQAGKIKRKSLFSEVTQVKLKQMSEIDMKQYFKKINPLDKAGAYAIQSKQPNIVESVKGSLTNAIGLPMEAVLEHYRQLKKRGID